LQWKKTFLFLPGKETEMGPSHFSVPVQVVKAADIVQLVLGPLYWLNENKTKKGSVSNYVFPDRDSLV